jgi:SAM-dependent methyltransferase
MAGLGQADHNSRIWGEGGFVDDYDTRRLEPVEVLLLARHRERFAGRVLEVGVGGGRLLGYLVALGGEVHGVDISERMIEHCRRRWPTAQLRVADLARLGETVDGPFDLILLGDNVIDVFADEQRRAVLSDIHGLLRTGGLIVFSTHNLAHLDAGGGADGASGEALRARAWQAANRSPVWMAQAVSRIPRRRANRRRLSRMQYRTADYAIVNDHAHDYALLHYYIRSDDQRRQLVELGFEPIEVAEPGGDLVEPGDDGLGPWLYYVASASERPAPA